MEPPYLRELNVTNALRWVSRKTMTPEFYSYFRTHDLEFTTVNISKLLAEFVSSYYNFTWLGLHSDETKVEKELLLAGLGTAE